ncbi:fimbrial protein [Serratia sp. IR-2025]
MDNVKYRWCHPTRVLAVLLAAAPLVTFASNMATVTVKVTVVKPPPCTINGDRTIDVNFGNVNTVDVDGKNYLTTVNYTLECGSGSSNAMKMAIMGAPTTFDRSALQTNITDFGIALKANGTPLTINNELSFTYPNKPVLQAVPVKRNGATLKGGGFSAGATMMVNYQ